MVSKAVTRPMASLRSERTLTIIVLLFLIIAGIGAVYFVYESQLPARASILPNVAVISSGQSVSLEVSWVGGTLPYAVTLYSSPTSACTTSSTSVSWKQGLASPSATFTVSPTTTTYYCATVVAPKISSAVSAAAVVTVRPAFATPSLVITPTAIDSGQTVTLTVTVNWAGGASPYSVTLYTGTNSSCTQDTTKATVLSGSNPLTSLVGTSATFLVKDPVSTNYYCAAVTDSSTNSHSTTSPAEPFTVNKAPSATITPAHPTIDSGQSITLTVVPSQGTPPYSYQWYTGTGCSQGSEVTGATTSVLSAGPLTSTLKYSVSITDGSTGTPSGSVCASVSGTVNSAFTGTSVVVSPSSVVIDSGQSVSLGASWGSEGTSPYVAQFYASPTPNCQSEVAVGDPQSVSGTVANITVSPTSTTYYCVSVKDAAASHEQASSSGGALVTVNPVLLPTISLSPSAIDIGQTATVTATVTWTGGTSPYTVTLYSGAYSICAYDTTVVTVLSPGSNPQVGVTGASAVFNFTAPAASAYYCASVTDEATTSNTAVAGSVQFTVNQALAASISPALPVIDNGSSITLNAVAGYGTSPYSYQWYSGSTCTAANAISGQTASSYSTGAIKSTRSFSVLITDGSPGTPPAQSCSPPVTVIVNHALDPSIALSLSAIDIGQTATVTATVTWTGGTSPYTVTLYSGTSTTCASDTTVVAVLSPSSNPQIGVTGASAVFEFTAPTASTQYCASVRDSATVQVTKPSPVRQFTVSPVVATPSIALSLSAIDTGQTATVTATVTWTGGTSPYTVTLYSGTSSTCSADTTLVAVLPDGNPQSGLKAVSTTFSFTAPVSTTDYCATVADGSAQPVSATTSSASAFTVNSILKVTVSPLSESVDSGQPFAVTLTATVTSGTGTAPYFYQWYVGATCSSGTISGQTSSSYSPGVISSTTSYSVGVNDSSTGTPAASACATSTVLVNPPLSARTLTLSPSAINIGQTPTVTATVTWYGGTSPYTVTLYSGTSSTCSYDTTVVSSNSGVVRTSTAFSLSAPASTTYYCATVTDSAPIPISATTSAALFTVNPALVVTISPASPTIDSGQSIVLTAAPSSGVSPYHYQWYAGSTCSVALSGWNSSTYTTSPSSTFSYSVGVTDSNTPTPNTACSTITVTVNAAFVGTLVTVSPPIVLDIGQSVTLTVSWSSAGTPTYTVQLTTSLTSSCSAPAPLESQTAVSGTSASFTIPPTSSKYYCAKVTDSAHSPESSSTTAADLVSAYPILAAGTPVLSPFTVDAGQTATVTATISWSGGASPYAVVLYSGSSSSCASDTTVVAVSGSNPQSGIAGKSTNFSFAFSGSNTYYCAKVTDSATTPVSVTSSSVIFTVNPALTASMSPASPTIDSGQSVVLTVQPSAGTAPYSYQWYTGSTCAAGSAISGQRSSSYSTGALSHAAYYSVLVTDSSPGIPGASSCAQVTVTVDPTLTATIDPASLSVDSGQSITLAAVPSGGTSPYFYQWYSGSGCVGANALAGYISQSYFTGPLTKPTNFSVSVTDNSVGTPAASACAGVSVTINPAPTAGAITPSAPAIDSGQSVTLTSHASAGTAPYSYRWYSGSSATCSSDTTLLGTASTQAVSPTSSTYYCYVVKDASTGTPAASATSATDHVTVNPALSAGAITPSAPAIDSGQSVTLTANPSGGTAPYSYRWYSGSSATCSSDTTLLGTASTQAVSPTSSTYYCYVVKDASTGTPAASATSATDHVTVNPALSAGAITPSAPAIDSGQSVTLTANPSGGTAPYSYQWYTGAGCTAAVSGATSATYSPSPTAKTTYYYKVTDDANTASTACSAGDAVSVNSALKAPVISVLNTSIGINGNSTLSTTTSFSGGTSTYSCQWLVESPTAVSFSDLGGSFSCTTSSLPTASTGVLDTAGAWQFELEVIDSSAVLTTVLSNVVTVTAS